ncbi:MAG: type III secretion system inner rod subunit SctI [Paracoccaceae bacterium]
MSIDPSMLGALPAQLQPQQTFQPQGHGQPGQTLAHNGGPGSSMAAFADAMHSAQGAQPVPGGPVQAQIHQAQFLTTGPAAPQGVQGVQSTDGAVPLQQIDRGDAAGTGADARDRVARTLELDAGPAASGPAGQGILDGLSRLRGTFDGQLAEMSSRVEGARMDVTDMMALQAEVVKYTVLVDVSSKLAGKSTQAMDSLMKGQ